MDLEYSPDFNLEFNPEFTEKEYRFIMEMMKYWYFMRMNATDEDRERACEIYAKTYEILQSLENN